MEKNTCNKSIINENSSTVTVSPFDYSIENHFNNMNTIRKLCAEEEEAIDAKGIELINPRVTFLREWKSYRYNPRTIRFSCETEGQEGKNVIGEANLSQFSSTNVPKMERSSSETSFTETSNDFVLYVGGHVWGLDWCPRVHQHSGCHVKCEYLAVAAHPSESPYHEIGTPLTGRGVIQIWCVLHTVKEESPPILKIQKGKTRKQIAEERIQKGKTKKQFAKEQEYLPFKRPRGRPRKESLHDSDGENQVYQARVRPTREKHKRKYLAESDIESDSVPVVDVDISQASSQFRASTGASMSTGYAQVENCDADGSNRDNQMVDATAVLSHNVTEKQLPPLKRARGRPKKQKNMKEPVVVLTSENESVPTLSFGISSEFLASTEATRSTEGCSLLKNFHADVVLDDSNREDQMAGASTVLSCDVKEKHPYLPNRARGRPKKQKDIKETVVVLNSENKFVPPLAVDISSGFLAPNEATMSTEEHSLLKNWEANVGFDDPNSENQMGEVMTVLPCKAKARESHLLKRARGRPRKIKRGKQKGLVEPLANLDTEKGFVPPLAFSVDSSQVPTGFLALTESTKSTEEHALVKSFDTDLGLNYSNGEGLMFQAASQSCNMKEKKSLLLKKTRGRPGKKKGTQEPLVDIYQVSPGFLAPTETIRSIEENALLKNCSADNYLDESHRGNKIVEATAVQSCNSTKKARGRPRKQKDVKECLVNLDIENQSVPPFSVGSSQVPSGFPALSEATMSTERHALVKSCDTHSRLNDSNQENLMVQAATPPCNLQKKWSLSLKKTRGRPRKQKGTQVSLVDLDTEHESILAPAVATPSKQEDPKECLVNMDAENQSVPPFSIGSSQVLSGFLALTGTTESTERHALVKRCNTNFGLNDSNSKDLMVQAAIPSYNLQEKKSLLLKKTRGRPRKQKGIQAALVDLDTENEPILAPAVNTPQKQEDMKECLVSLDIESQSVPPFSVSSSQVSSGFLAFTEITKSTDGHASVKSYDTNFDSKREDLIVQATPCNLQKKKSLLLKKTRGRPRKQKCVQVPSVDLDAENEPMLAPVVDTPRASCGDVALTEAAKSKEEDVLMKSCDMNETKAFTQWCNENTTANRVSTDKARKNKEGTEAVCHNDGVSPVAPTQDEDKDLFFDVPRGSESYHQHGMMLDSNEADNGSLVVNTSGFDPPRDVTLPRIVFCLAHNGKVAWDVKWRPGAVSDVEHKHRMGYLAVLLGNGSIEVWEVPSPRAVETLFSSCTKEGTDPRFVKLEPVFRCSKLKSGDRHSIPLTMEWSTSSPYDLLLAGCHDGTVALWKFAPSSTSADTRPLLCFRADTHPIRALAWAPDESDEDSANIIVTAGDGGVRFWDIRDPYRPLWCLKLVQRTAYSLAWLPDPSCVIVSIEDGTLRILSLSRITSESPVTGKLCAEIQKQGLQNHSCSSFPIWSVHASRLTGQAVFCSSDGSVLHFQITSKSVDKDKSRYKEPHFLCGSLSEEDATLTVNTPIPNIPFEMKKSLNELGDTSRSFRSRTSDSIQVKRGHDQASGHEALALCYNNDPSQFDSRDTLPVSKSTVTSMMSKNRELDSNSVQGDKTPKTEKVVEAAREIEVFPPKIVSMHRVRWNMNKGSERLVCYGGAAGIVRCQEILTYSSGGRSRTLNKGKKCVDKYNH